MTDRSLLRTERKQHQRCARCRVDLPETHETVECDRCQRDLRWRVAECKRRKRRERKMAREQLQLRMLEAT